MDTSPLAKKRFVHVQTSGELVGGDNKHFAKLAPHSSSTMVPVVPDNSRQNPDLTSLSNLFGCDLDDQ